MVYLVSVTPKAPGKKTFSLAVTAPSKSMAKKIAAKKLYTTTVPTLFTPIFPVSKPGLVGVYSTGSYLKSLKKGYTVHATKITSPCTIL